MSEVSTAPGDGQVGLHVLPVCGRWLLYNAATGAAALVNAAAVRELAAGAAPAALGLADLESPEPSEKPARNRAYTPRFLGLVTTRMCNLDCGYCGFRGGLAAGPCMEPKLAAAAIDWFASLCRDSGQPELSVHLFGGEPFLARDAVEVAVHRTRAVAVKSEMRPRLEAATNGCYGEAMARFIGDCFHVVALSLDGPPEIHNRHRPRPGGLPSYDNAAATAGILSESNCELILRVCVSQLNAGRMAETVAWFCENFQPSAVHFEPLQATPDSTAAGLLTPTPDQFAAGFVAAIEEGRPRGVGVGFSGSTLGRHGGFCPAANDGAIVSPDGRVSGCYLLEKEWRAQGLDLNTGYVDPSGLVRIDTHSVARIRETARLPYLCESCFCRNSCAGGCVVHHSHGGNLRERDGFCAATRMIAAALLLEDLGAGELGREMLLDAPSRARIVSQDSDWLGGWRAA
jgi:uncharacterized protein